MLPGVFFDLERAASGDEHPDGRPVAAPVHLHPAKEALVLRYRPPSRVKLDPANVVDRYGAARKVGAAVSVKSKIGRSIRCKIYQCIRSKMCTPHVQVTK